MASLTVALGVPAGGAQAVTTAGMGWFADVPFDHPFRSEIEWMGEHDIATGYPDGTFHPTEEVSRQAMAAFLYRAAGRPPYAPPATPRFSDVPRSHSFYTEISWLADSGVTAGYADGTFHPTEAVSRQAMAAFLYRSIGGPDVTPPADAQFPDVAAGAPFATEISWLASTGISTGYADGTFHPTEAVSRQAMAAFVCRLRTRGTTSVLPMVGVSAGRATFVSVASDGTLGDRGAFDPAVSADGRWIAFDSEARTLVPGDTNAASDVFVTDRTTGVTTRVSLASDGAQANGASARPSISGDGRWVAYESAATNLVAGDSNGRADLFLTDTVTGATTRVAPSGGSGAVSADGRWIAYESGEASLVPGDTNGLFDVFVTDRTTGATTRVSTASGTQANGSSADPAISADGRWVTYVSAASNLVPGDTNGVDDVFVTDRTTGVTSLVSVATNGTRTDALSAEPAISGDGRWIAYRSLATNLVPGDGLSTADVFVTDRTTGVTTLASAGPGGAVPAWRSYAPSISADGRWIAYTAYRPVTGMTTRVDIVVTDRTSGWSTRAGVADDARSYYTRPLVSAISADGRRLAYESIAVAVAAGDTNSVTDVFTNANPLQP